MTINRLDDLPPSAAAEATDTPALPVSAATAPTLLTLPSVAKRLAVSVRTARRLIDGGELPHVRIGNSIRISELDLAEFIARNRRTTRPKNSNKE